MEQLTDFVDDACGESIVLVGFVTARYGFTGNEDVAWNEEGNINYQQ